ncbi:MAG: 4-phosphoerythronate dehydrogenase [Thiotrichales bacterium]|nr:4-phosphoerythronate dehydrogenase [Thiotrichales bacterium]
MPKLKTIIIDDAIPFAKEMFNHLGNIQLIPGKAIDANIAKTADALIIRSRTQINEALLADSSVSFVGSTVVGLDHVDQDYLKSKAIHFYSAQGCNSNSVAEYIITCLLILAEKHSFDLTNKTIGIIGVGHVGSLVLKKAKALGMTCILNDPPKVQQHPELSSEYTDLETCLKADIVTVHTPLTVDGDFPTSNLISEQHLLNIKPNQILINAARGGIINEQAWCKTQTLANIIDCWENEPEINETLYNTATIATPHIAGHSLDAKIAGTEMVYHTLCMLWHIEPKTEWKQALPKEPEPYKFNGNLNQQSQSKLLKIIQHTHNPIDDDLAIRSKNIHSLHKKYEDYRRNFPVYREWKHHTVILNTEEKITNTLIKLDFNVK